MRLQLWYDDSDRFDAEVVTPNATFGPYSAPAAENVRDTQFTADFNYYHNGSQVDFSEAASSKREILIDLIGPTGEYVLRLTGATVTSGTFNAWLNPANFSSTNTFDNFVVPGYTIWEMAAAESNISPNDYVMRTDYTDIDGIGRSRTGEGDVGDLWVGSGIGPTVDGRTGITVSAPGEFLIAPYGERTYYSTFRFNTIFDGGSGGLYGIQTAVSAASPVVTGIIALMLEANPQLDAAQVKDILQSTARTDSFTGVTPNNTWGYGKVDALAAVDAVVQGTSIDTVLPERLPEIATINYPDPFQQETTISFELTSSNHARIAVYDILGREVDVLVDGTLPPGKHEVIFSRGVLSKGTYLYRISAGGLSSTGIMTLVD